jgi:hypothetical protein
VNVLSEEDSIGTKTDEAYIPSAFSIKKAEPKALFLTDFFGSYWCVYTCMCVLFFLQYVICNMTSNSERAYSSFTCMKQL